MEIIDISVPITAYLPVYEGDPAPKINRVADLEHGDPYTLSRIDFGAHTGTHVDAPLHFIRGGATVDQLDLDVLMGPASVVDLSLAGDKLHAADLESVTPTPIPERILLKTGNSSHWKNKEFYKRFVALAPDGANWLVEHGVRLVGIDYLSIEPFGSISFDVHHLLLAAGVVIVEGLDLSAVSEGQYHLVCLPLRIQGAEGAPARAVLLRSDAGLA